MSPLARLFAIATLACLSSTGQIHYNSGQNVVPVFEGWERNADGSFNMVFGYMNRNYEEQVEIPIGPDNAIEPGPPDQGQPAHFYARRQEFVFKVKVPKDWGDKDLIWTLRSRGKTEKAYGSLMRVWELGNMVYLENRRGSAALTYPEEPNQPPSIEMVGSSQRTVAAGEPLNLSVAVTDDGYPRPRARSPRRPGRDSDSTGPRPQSPFTQAVVGLDPGVRLGVTWVLYRGGAGTVTFDPMRAAVENGRASTKVIFSQPGKYTLRAYADDGVLLTPLDVTVNVSEPRP